MRKMSVLRSGLPLIIILLLWLLFVPAALAGSMDAVWPESSGTDVQTSGKLIVDMSHKDLGYIMARVSEPSKHAFKVRMSFGKGQLTYDLNSDGNFEVFPLQLGSGKYEFALFENVKGSKYSSEGKVDINVQLRDENAAFLVPNQYVDYELWTSAVQKSDELVGSASAADAYTIITDFIKSEFSYDFVRAKTISSGQLPEIDYCYENRMGICQDLAAVMVCMLRVQGVPSKLVIGYADKYYHAWTTSVVDGKEVFFDPTAAIGALNAKKYSTERIY